VKGGTWQCLLFLVTDYRSEVSRTGAVDMPERITPAQMSPCMTVERPVQSEE
jgi:hypothetical protein